MALGQTRRLAGGAGATVHALQAKHVGMMKGRPFAPDHPLITDPRRSATPVAIGWSWSSTRRWHAMESRLAMIGPPRAALRRGGDPRGSLP